ncbi:MAG: phosphatidate cytidylyltransferase [Deltaproteobacteria bacterium]|nr:phosphatidate cytidylyltransferase [Deltaproteobacteria bacterium]
MATRIISALVALPLVILVVQLGGWTFAALILAVGAVCLWEFAGMVLPGDKLGRSATVGVGLAMLLLGLVGRFSGGDAVGWFCLAPIGLLTFFLFRTGDMATVASRAGLACLAVLWAGILLVGTAAVRFLPRGEAWLYLVCVLAWGSDTGAYFTGRFLGKRKLYEKVSPKKTWEGAVGGVVVATAGAFLLMWALGAPNIPIGHLVVLAPVAAAFGQVGDLSESLLKRSMGVKDSGRIMPGHGGLLDRVDAVLFIGPILFLYAQVVLGEPARWLALTPSW